MSLKLKDTSVFLVTGGAGFIGSNIIEYLLEKEQKVRCLDDLSTGSIENIKPFMDNENFEFIEGSIEDYETCLIACNGISYVSHQAAWGSVPRSILMPIKYEEINIKGTLNMLEASRINGIKKFVYASSSSVYGDSKNLPKVEGDEGKVLSPYALTKKVDEEYANLFSKLYSLETVGLRYFNVFGKRQNPDGAYAAVIPKFITKIMNDDLVEINGDGEHSRDFTYIDNVVMANINAMMSGPDVSGIAMNIACGGRITLNELYDEIISYTGITSKREYVNERKGDIKHSHASIDRARRLIDYSCKVDFMDGLKKTIDWYQASNTK